MYVVPATSRQGATAEEPTRPPGRVPEMPRHGGSGPRGGRVRRLYPDVNRPTVRHVARNSRSRYASSSGVWLSNGR